MSRASYLIDLVEKQGLMIVLGLALVSLLGLSFAYYRSTVPEKGGPVKSLQLNGSSVKVVSPSPTTLSNNGSTILNSNQDSASPSTSLNPQNPNSSSPGEASSQPLQSNTNINDPAISNSPMVQELLNGM